MPHPSALPIGELLAHCDVRFQKKGGPGGQHRNKVETAAVLTHSPSGISAEAGERRSQAENRRRALFRLRVNLAIEVRSEPLPGEPSPLWQSRAKGGRIRVSGEHNDFPALLAESLDSIAGEGCDVSAAAKRLGVSTSQLVKLLKVEPRALAAVNNARCEMGLRDFR